MTYVTLETGFILYFEDFKNLYAGRIHGLGTAEEPNPLAVLADETGVPLVPLPDSDHFEVPAPHRPCPHPCPYPAAPLAPPPLPTPCVGVCVWGGGGGRGR